MKEILKKIKQTAPIACIFIGALFLIQKTYPTYIPVIFFSIALVFIIWNSIGMFFYSKAAKVLKVKTRENYNKATLYLEKAVKWGINENAQISAGTLMVQYGNIENGGEVLKRIVETAKDKKVVGGAKISLSMYYWLNKDLDRAIELCQEARGDGIKDKNLYVNLLTYLLEKEDMKEYKKVMKECNDLSMATPAMLDMEAAVAIYNKDWKKAGEYLKSLFDKTVPGYKDPYIHQAMILMHYGEWEEAAKTLSSVFSSCVDSNIALYSHKEVEEIIDLIKDENTRWGVREFFEDTPESVQKGIMPTPREGVVKPETPSLPSFVAESVSPTSTELSDDERDEGDVDTSLNDDDEEWIRKHQSE